MLRVNPNTGAAFLKNDSQLTLSFDGYSVLWFAPNQTFNGQRKVSWDVNVTDLKPRQWFEVAIIPAVAGG